jgi:DNA-binding NarL/FixJ family response regulator
MVDPIRVKGNIVGVFGIAIPSSDDLPRPFGTEELSPRQLDVLRLLVQGKSTNQIAADLHLAPETVRNYVGSLLKTLGARSRSRQLSSRFGTASSPWIWTEGPGPAGP